MNAATKVFLVVLRLAIGWHFLFEGLDKLNSISTGPTETNRPFSSAGYFREAPGPLGNWMRGVVGDPDEEALARLVVRPLPAGPLEQPSLYVPPGLAKEWDDYSERFSLFYDLDGPRRDEAEMRLQQAKSNLVSWLTWNDKTKAGDDKDKKAHGIKTIKKVYPSGTVEVEQTVPERIADYQHQLRLVRDTQTNKLWLFRKDVEKQRLLKDKADLIQMRTALLKDLAEKTDELKKSLADILTPEQKAIGSVPAPPGNRALYWLDMTTAWGLTAMGGCLLIGFLTRLNCVLLAGFLFMTYLAVPAFPWLPVPPNNEGNYYYVNKNLIELLALLLLATTYSGRWFGLDGLFHLSADAERGTPKTPTTPAPAPAAVPSSPGLVASPQSPGGLAGRTA